MNLAFPALLFLILILPGIIFRYYFSTEDSTKIDPNPFSADVIIALIFSVAGHFIWIYGATLLGFTVHIDFVFGLLINPGQYEREVIQTLIGNSYTYIILYFFSLSLISGIFGWGLRSFLKNRAISGKSKGLGIYSNWFYLFVLAYDTGLSHDATLVSFLMDTDDGVVIYTGLLEEFFLKEKGQLDFIVLGSVFRRKLKDDYNFKKHGTKSFNENQPNLDQRYYPISADRFVAKYDQIKNLTITYLHLEEVSETEQE
ncbi:MAG: hypothetical protein V3R64_07995 [Sphingomonadales bacterium]